MPFSLAASRAAAVEKRAAAALSSTLFLRLSSSRFLRHSCCSYIYNKLQSQCSLSQEVTTVLLLEHVTSLTSGLPYTK